MTAKQCVAIVVVLVAQIVLANDGPYRDFSREGREYSQSINKEFATNEPSAYVLPPVNTNAFTASTNRWRSCIFRDAPVTDVLYYYTDISGMSVEADEDILSDPINFASEAKYTDVETLCIALRLLTDRHIVLTKITGSSVWAHRAGATYSTSRAPGQQRRMIPTPNVSSGGDAGRRPSYADRRRLRMATESQTNAAQSSKYSVDDSSKQSSEYKLELIRAGLPPLPLPLAPKRDAQLIRENANAQK